MKKALPFLIAALMLPQALHAMFAQPQSIPVDRLVAKAERYIKEKPEDPEGHYTLARIHYAAFAYQSSLLAAHLRANDDGSRPPHLDPGLVPSPRRAQENEALRRVLELRKLDAPPQGDETFHEEVEKELGALRDADWKPPVLSPAEGLQHFLAARDGFEKVIAMAPDNALYALGKASLWRQFSTPKLHGPLEKEAGVPAVLGHAEVAELFYKAFTLAKRKDAELKHMPISGLSAIISYEAGNAYLELAPEGGHAAEVKEHLESLKKLKAGAVTPLVFSTRAADRELRQVVNEGASVSFDLRGMGEEGKWPWLQSHAAFLVWDGENSGIVRDGRQLFGTYTWGVFWRDGFEAISMLDDDDNGTLSGGELKGIRVWQDLNGNAVCDPGEVRDLSEMGIRAISCTATGMDGNSPLAPQGIIMSDGTHCPLWDWVLRPIDAGEPPAAP